MARRLARLEAEHAPPCGECGHAPGGPVEGYDVEWTDIEEAEPAEPEFCEACGRQLVYVVEWDDIPSGEGGP